MSNEKAFEAYAAYYDLLYKDKAYDEEAEYVSGLIKNNESSNAKTILELGSGSGKHAKCLNDIGYKVHGIDLSSEMVEQATVLAAKYNDISFEVGDVRNYRANKKFDVVISLFHVMSYQNTNDDLLKAFETASNHLDVGGLFVFDCWYGPGVLTDLPSTRVKRLENEKVKIMRIAEPVMHHAESIVDVNYTVFVQEKGSGSQLEINETHKMRYLFQPEIISLFKQAGLELVKTSEGLSKKALSEDSWTGFFVGRKL